MRIMWRRIDEDVVQAYVYGRTVFIRLSSAWSGDESGDNGGGSTNQSDR